MEKTNLELFRQALTEAVSSKIDSVIEGCDEEFEISDRHKTAMQAILDGTYERRSGWKSTKAKVAAILVAAALLLASCAVIYRDEIGGFIKEVYDEYVQITYSDIDSTPKTIEKVYEFTYIPEGYTFEKSYIGVAVVRYTYTNCDNDFIAFEQSILNGSVAINNKGSSVVTVNISGIEIYHISTRQNIYYLWSDGEYSYEIESSQPIEYSELEKIIEGIK